MKRVCINKVILSPADRNCSGSQPCKQRDPETLRAARLLRMTPSCGFTLVELLVVVLIIGILSAVAIPMYQGAVDKSRWSTLLTPAKALQTAQAAAHLETGAYVEEASALVVSLPGEAEDNKYVMPDAQYTLSNKNDNLSTITGELTALPNVRLSMFLKHPESYLFCDAKTGDSRAERLCEKLLGGTKAYTKEGYTQYILDYPGTCVWANSTGQCYVSEEAKCTGQGMPYEDGFCGYTNAQTPVTVNEGGVCYSTGATGYCAGAIVNDGGICIGDARGGCEGAIINNGGMCKGGKTGNWQCGGATINEGGTCMGQGRYVACANVIVNGGTCIAQRSGDCTGTYNSGCCEDYGKNKCPDYAPKCSD